MASFLLLPAMIIVVAELILLFLNYERVKQIKFILSYIWLIIGLCLLVYLFARSVTSDQEIYTNYGLVWTLLVQVLLLINLFVLDIQFEYAAAVYTMIVLLILYSGIVLAVRGYNDSSILGVGGSVQVVAPEIERVAPLMIDDSEEDAPGSDDSGGDISDLEGSGSDDNVEIPDVSPEETLMKGLIRDIGDIRNKETPQAFWMVNPMKWLCWFDSTMFVLLYKPSDDIIRDILYKEVGETDECDLSEIQLQMRDFAEKINAKDREKIETTTCKDFSALFRRCGGSEEFGKYGKYRDAGEFFNLLIELFDLQFNILKVSDDYNIGFTKIGSKFDNPDFKTVRINPLEKVGTSIQKSISGSISVGISFKIGGERITGDIYKYMMRKETPSITKSGYAIRGEAKDWFPIIVSRQPGAVGANIVIPETIEINTVDEENNVTGSYRAKLTKIISNDGRRHYISYILNGNSWFKYDDISPTPWQKILSGSFADLLEATPKPSGQGRILIYEKTGLDERGGEFKLGELSEEEKNNITSKFKNIRVGRDYLMEKASLLFDSIAANDNYFEWLMGTEGTLEERKNFDGFVSDFLNSWDEESSDPFGKILVKLRIYFRVLYNYFKLLAKSECEKKMMKVFKTRNCASYEGLRDFFRDASKNPEPIFSSIKEKKLGPNTTLNVTDLMLYMDPTAFSEGISLSRINVSLLRGKKFDPSDAPLNIYTRIRTELNNLYNNKGEIIAEVLRRRGTAINPELNKLNRFNPRRNEKLVQAKEQLRNRIDQLQKQFYITNKEIRDIKTDVENLVAYSRD